MADIRIGTSGYHYKHWLGRYYPKGMKPGQMLAHYLRDHDQAEGRPARPHQLHAPRARRKVA